MSARQRRSHAAILRGIAVALALCEIASRASVTPGLFERGLEPLLALPFFGPSLLGAFASQVLLRPRRAELAAAAAIAAALVWPIGLFASGPFALATAVSCALGTGSLAVLAAVALRDHVAAVRSGVAEAAAARDDVLAILLPALLLPGFVVLAYPMIYLTAALWPTTYDHRMYLADAAFGAPLSFSVGRLTASVPMLNGLCLAVYVCLPLALMLVHALRQRTGVRSGDALVAFVAVTVVGYAGYHVVPVTGPIYVFGSAFPMSPPDPSTLDGARALAPVMPRNCMPSLHSAWALLVWWNARPLSRAVRAAAAAFLAITLLATVALGFHYVVDLVAAFPLTMAVQAWATRATDERLRSRAISTGAALTVAWIAFVTWSGAALAMPAPLLWVLAATVVGVACVLERRVFDARAETADEQADARATGWQEAGAANLLNLSIIGFAAAMHHEMLSNALAVELGSSLPIRVGMASILPFGLALGVVATEWSRTLRSAKAAAVAASLATGWAIVSPDLLPSLGRFDAGTASRAILIVLMLSPTAVAAGVMLACGIGRSHVRPAALLLSAVCAGIGIATLVATYVVRPTLTFHQVALAAFAAAAIASIAVAMRGRAHVERTVEARFPATGSFPGVLAIVAPSVVAGSLLAVLASLANAILGDTVYARGQIAGVIAIGMACGVALGSRLVSGATGTRDVARAAVTIPLAVVVALLPWSDLPGYFASFHGYVSQHRMMTVFRQREFVRFAATVLVLLPSAVSAGAALVLFAAHGERDRAARAGMTWAIATTSAVLAAIATRLVLLHAVGARAIVFAAAAGTIVMAAFVLRRFGPTRWRVAALATAVVLLPLAAHRLDERRLVTASGLTLQPDVTPEPGWAAVTRDGLLALHERGEADALLTIDGQLLAMLSPSAPPVTIAASGFTSGRSRALVAGLGDGRSAPALLEAGFGEVTVAEPRSALAGILQRHDGGAFGRALASGKLSLVAIDGRSAIRRASLPFDLIRIDEGPMSAPEASLLSTREFYLLASQHLAPGGALEQELALERLSAVALTSVLASMRASFDAVHVYFAAGRALVVSCSDCGGRPDESAAAATLAAMEGKQDGKSAATSSGRGWLGPADTDRLLAAMAGKLEVEGSSLATRDRDLFLAFQVPYAFVEQVEQVEQVEKEQQPQSVKLLESFAAASPPAGP